MTFSPHTPRSGVLEITWTPARDRTFSTKLNNVWGDLLHEATREQLPGSTETNHCLGRIYYKYSAENLTSEGTSGHQKVVSFGEGRL